MVYFVYRSCVRLAGLSGLTFGVLLYVVPTALM